MGGGRRKDEQKDFSLIRRMIDMLYPGRIK
jgi:hypothetical protein